jgi:uncharacterized membrane protein YhhN
VTAGAWTLVALAGLVAVVDWYGAGTDNRQLRYVAKPLTLVLLIAAALTLHPVNETMRTWFVIGLVFGLLGDVFLMLEGEQWFVPGLGSFLVCHLCYIPGFIAGGVTRTWVIVGGVVVAAAVATVAPRVVRGARSRDPKLLVPVSVYVGVISVMVAFAVGTTVPLVIAGAVLFYLSDLMIGWSTFVTDVRGAELFIITTYHVAQALLVISLAIAR